MNHSDLFGSISPDVGNVLFIAMLLLASLCVRLLIVKSLFPLFQRLPFWPRNLKLSEFLFPTVWLLVFILLWRLTSDVLVVRPDTLAALNKGIQVLLIIVLTWISFKALTIIRHVIFSRININVEDNLEQRKMHTRVHYLVRIGYILVGIVGLCLVLMQFEGIRAYGVGILTSAGLAGIVLGFAAQKSLANLIAGFQVAFSQPIRIDDVVIVENEWGRIEEINLTFVVVRLWDERRLVVPVNYFIDKSFQNWTRVTSALLGHVFLYLDYTTPIEPIRQFFKEQVAQSNLWDGKVAVVQVTDTTERSMQVRFLMSARNAGDAFDLRCLMRERLIVFLRDHFPESLPRERVDVVKKLTPTGG